MSHQPSLFANAEPTRITIIDYDESHFAEKEAKNAEDCFPFRDTPSITWLEITGLGQPSMIEEIGRHFDLHPLILEDILHTDQRPKVEDFPRHLVIILKMISRAQDPEDVRQLSLVLGSNFLISIAESDDQSKFFASIRERMRGGASRTRRMGADYLLYTLLDAIVDNYYAVLETIGTRIGDLEERLISNPEAGAVRSTLTLRRKISTLGRHVWPLREVINSLRKGDSPFISDSSDIYFSDVYDHVVKIFDTLQLFQETRSQMFDMYRSNLLNKSNEIMKVLTIIATIFIPLTFIASIYGMNFTRIPELASPYGYPAVLIAMAAIACAMLLFFRRKNWF